jgi:hypothetical protein
MKLYTEEQVKEAISLAIVTLSDKSPYPKNIVLSEIKGIELPSDEEIDKNGYHDKEYNDIWIEGAKWIRDKITNTKEK